MPRNLTRRWGLAGAILLLAGPATFADAREPVLVPPPKQVRWSGAEPLELEPDAVAIVLGSNPDVAEQCAADMLQRYVAKRFQQTWPILRGSGQEVKQESVVLLGQRTTNAWLDRLCEEKGIDLGTASPGHDGYVIEAFSLAGRNVVLVGGSDARGVLYGQDTLFQLLAEHEGRLTLRQASVRDWPTVPWRGRPQTAVVHHLQPGIMDCYVASRVNFIDLRNGVYAFQPDYQLTGKDKADIATAIADAHKRGIIVYGSVNCGVPIAKQDRVLAMFRQFISLGVDGLWLSFDDKGPGEAPEGIVLEALKLASQHGISGARIAITPPKGSYQVIGAPFNRSVMAIPGMERALWFWTALPSPGALADARSIGLEVKPSWWHNWPRPDSGFTHIGNNSLCRRSYLEVPPMSAGWHEPDYEYLADNGCHLEAVMPWGGNAWNQYYVVPVICWWGWNPEHHDWKAVRARIYDIVFGPSPVSSLVTFDDTLASAKSLFIYPWRGSCWKPLCPARLRSLDDRQEALELLAKLESVLQRIEKRRGEETVLDQTRSQTNLLGAMRTELKAGRAAATAPYPEYWWDEHQRKVLSAIYDDDTKRAEQLAAGVRERVVHSADQIGKALGFLSGVKEYAAWWTRRANLNGQGWRDLVAERRAELPQRVCGYGYYEVLISNLLKELDNVPYGRGRGGAERELRVLATVLPDGREQFRGDWLGGPYGEGGQQVAVFALHRDAYSHAGDFCELGVAIPVSGRRDRLGLLVFMNRYTKDKLGLEHVKGRWAGFCSVQLIWGDRVLWERDVGLPRDGSEWDLVRLPVVPETLAELPLRLRVVDRKNSNGMRAIVFVGPIRLVELPE